MKSILCGIALVFMLLPGAVGFAAPNVGVGAGALFLQPHELTDASGHAPLVSARPCLYAGLSEKLPGSHRWSLEPQLSFVMPSSNRDEEISFTAFFSGDLGFMLGSRLTLRGGLGALATVITSEGRNVDEVGHFVTPAGNSTTWLVTTDLGVSYWLDNRLRLDAQTLAVRLFNATARRWRFLVGLTYVL